MKDNIFWILIIFIFASCNTESDILQDKEAEYIHIPAELRKLIYKEKAVFTERFGYVNEHFRLTPIPQWDTPQIIQLNEQDANIFIRCENIKESELDNDIVFVLSKRGKEYFSYIKMLPDSKKSSSRLIAYCQEERVYMELYSSQPGGGTTTQQLGYLKKKDRVETRNTDCWNHEIDVMIGIGYSGDGQYYPIYERMMKLICRSPFDGGGGGIYVPEPDYTGVIPPYKPPSGGGGSSDSGNSEGGGSSSGGNSGTGGGTESSAESNTGGNTGGSTPRPPSGGGGSGGGNGGPIPSWGYPDSDDPGGMDFLPNLPKKYIQDPYYKLRKQIAEKAPKLMKEVEKYTPWPNGVLLKPGEHCGVNARVRYGNIEICTQFFENENLADNDRVAIIYHEVYHIKNDKPTEMKKKRIDPIRLDPPTEFKEFIMTYLVVPSYYENYNEPYKTEAINSAYDGFITIYEIGTPTYYENEIKAYENEINIMTNVSSYYQMERKFMLWRHKEAYKISLQKYYNQ